MFHGTAKALDRTTAHVSTAPTTTRSLSLGGETSGHGHHGLHSPPPDISNICQPN